MLPFPARCSAHGIDRTGRYLQGLRCTLTLDRRIRSKAHSGRPRQRNSDHRFEMRHITMPAQLSPGSVFCNHCVAELRNRDTRPLADLLTQRIKTSRDVRCGQQFIVCEVVAASVTDDATFGIPLLVARLSKWQCLDQPRSCVPGRWFRKSA